MSRLARFWMVVQLAFRNLYSAKGKNILVGFLMLFGTCLVVLGTSLLDSIEHSMAKSITASVAGHLQVYDKNARDDLALFGSGFMGQSDIGVIADFDRVKKALSQVPNVKAVVPMGTNMAEFYSSTLLDRTIESLRQALSAGQAQKAQAIAAKIRAMATMMEGEFNNRLQVLKNQSEVEKQLSDIRRVKSAAFWQDLETQPDRVIEFLDTRLAPLVDENDGYFMRYLGTDLQLFAQNFETFEMVHGQMIPPGRRGLLVNQKFYDDVVRNRVARVMAYLHQKLIENGETIADDPLLQNIVDRLVRQYRRITFQLQPDDARMLAKQLQAYLPGAQGPIEELVQEFLRVTDDNFQDRHRFFFANIAPKIRLYLFDIGDVVTIRSYTKSGYLKSVNVKVYGSFSFKGLEKSDLAGAFNLMDIITFRDLYGMMTQEKRAELQKIQAQIGLADIAADQAENALFGETDQPGEAVRANAQGFDEFADIDLKATTDNGKSLHDTTYDQADIDQGMALHAAIVLEDPTQLVASQRAIEQAIDQHQLGLQVVDWQTASGMVGQMVTLVRVILYVAILIIFLVALVIINNTMVMATMERSVEIGTIRAIGGQRAFVLTLFLIETLLLGTAAGFLGAGLGAGLVSYFGQVGIPAAHDVLVLLFSGPRLYPSFGLGNLIAGASVILGVSVLATFYPALIATRIQPVVAM